MASIKNLIAIDGSERIIWNSDLGQLEISEDDSTQNLLLTTRPYFTVKDVQISPAKNLLALIGDQGVTIVEMPPKWGRRYKGDLKENQTYCKTYNINERLYTCDKRIKILHAKWHPLGIEAKQVLCILTNDNRLRFHDVVADLQIQVINLKIRQESDDSADDSYGLSLGISLMNLGEYAICFDIGPPFVVEESDVLWPIYILMGSGDVYLIYTNFQNPTYSEHIIGPLTMLPQAEDNYGSDACSLIVLDSSPPMLAIATPNGSIYHCFAFPEEGEVLPKQTLYVYESIELSKDLIENPDDSYSPHQMRLFKDPTSGIRYFCIHQNGVHTVVVPILETIQTESDMIDEKESFSEFIICTRTTTPSDESECEDISTPHGLGVEVRQTSIVLLVLLPKNELIVNRISPATTLINRKRFPRHSLNASRESNDPEILNLSQVDASRVNFHEQIQQILKRKTSIPMLKLTENLEQKKQIGELVNRAVATLESEYIRKYNLAADAIKKKLGLLENDMQNQKAEYAKIFKEKDEVYISVIGLASRAGSVCQKQKDLLARVDKILAAVSHGHPDLSEAEAKLRREMHSLREKLRQQRDHLDSVINKHKYHINQRDPTFNSNGSLVLTAAQLSGIKETLSRQGAEITEMKRAIKLSEAAK